MRNHNPFEGRKLVDLSAPLGEALPCTWPGHLPFARRRWRDIGEQSRYRTGFVVMDEHCGTHVDAAAHFIPDDAVDLPLAGPAGSRCGESLDLAQLCGPAAVIDVRDLAGDGAPGRSPWITAGRIQAWESRHGTLEPGDIVLFASGWSDQYRAGAAGRGYLQGPAIEGSMPGWPAPDVEAILYLADRGILTVGTEAASLGAVQDGAPMHLAGLGRGMHFIEGLCNLVELPALGAFFMFLPLKIVASTGCPGRAVALLAEAL
jgi:kynurenine formamidase